METFKREMRENFYYYGMKICRVEKNVSGKLFVIYDKNKKF